MRLVVIGVNHKTAPVAMRERLAFAGDDLTAAITELNSFTGGSVIVSTCNRTELYILLPKPEQTLVSSLMPSGIETYVTGSAIDRDAETGLIKSNAASPTSPQQPVLGHPHLLLNDQAYIEHIQQWLAQYKGLSLAQIQPYLYSHVDAHALTHWLRVASGLDSMILGEPQILGQIKQAVSIAQSLGGIDSRFGWIIDQVFASAKQVRNDTKVGSQAVSLGFAAAKLVTQIFDNPPGRTLLLVAAGEMNRLVATHIAGLGIGRIIICNRSAPRAEALAVELRQIGAQVLVRSLQELPELLPQADIVSSCSGSMNSLITRSMTKAALKQRRYQPMLMVDLAVPRDIEPSVSALDDVYLYSIDDLQHVIAGNIEQRRQAAVDAELLVSQLVIEIERRFQVRQVGRDIELYREQTKSYADVLLAESLAKLAQGKEPAEAIMTELTRLLTQTLTHAPSKLMRKAAGEGDPELLDFVVTGLNEAYRRRP
ncbi:MAG: glutamyl-tRNA reductase [Psychrobacter sp.]|nr:glutamyl-tRNA reductase [Psychrobacter sp.]